MTEDVIKRPSRFKTKVIIYYKWLRKTFPCDRVLAQRIFKATVNSTMAFILCLFPKVRHRLGNSPAMLPLISVIVHPGRRISGTIHGSLYCITGLIIGLAYSIFGRYLGQKCLGSYWKTMSEEQIYKTHYRRYESALGIMAMFEVGMLFIHGWCRSVNPHYFGIVFPFFLVVHFVFMASLTETNGVIADSFATPFYLGIAMSILFNLTLFPEFGSTYLGNSIVDTLNDFQRLIDHSVNYFTSINDPDLINSFYGKAPRSLEEICDMKLSIAKDINNCFLTFHECLYEISYSYVAPQELENVMKNLRPLSIYVNGIVDACELESTLINKNEEAQSEHNEYSEELSDPRGVEQEIKYADPKKLFSVLDKVRPSIVDIHTLLSESLYQAKVVLAYVYDVDLKRVKSCNMFKDVEFSVYKNKKEVRDSVNLDNLISNLEDGLITYGTIFREELTDLELNFLEPDDEMFLFSLFLVNLRKTVESVLEIVKIIRQLEDIRKEKEAKGWFRGKTLWINFLRNSDTLKKWFFRSYTGGSAITEEEALQGVVGQNYASFPNAADIPFDEEERAIETDESSKSQEDSEPVEKNSLLYSPPKTKKRSLYVTEPNMLARFIIFIKKFCFNCRFHFRFGLQIAVALMLSSFPMFTPKMRGWYRNYQGPWVGFVCILAMEPSVGDTIFDFCLRSVGVFIGSVWAYVSYLTGRGNDPYLEVVITCFGSVPGFYFFFSTPYVKAAIIEIISIYVVMLAAIIKTSVPGGIIRNFGKRCLAIGYGGGIGLAVQLTVYPLKARDQLNSEVAYICGCIAKMGHLYATALEGQTLKETFEKHRYEQYLKVSQGARAALGRANQYHALTKWEVRIKGDFSKVKHLFDQVLFVLRQILDRMDNIALLRSTTGSAIIEEFNNIIYPYRRQYIGSLSCTMRCLQEAFTNKRPLPQYLPSTRINHRRLVNAVRQIIENRYKDELDAMKIMRRGGYKDRFNDDSDSDFDDDAESGIIVTETSAQLHKPKTGVLHNYYLEEKFLSWNATSSASEDIIAYMEELINLTKMLVGVNEFKYGFLSRPLYEDWTADAIRDFNTFIKNHDNSSASSPEASGTSDFDVSSSTFS